MRQQVIIENPVINSPFEEPQRHFRFAEDGITDEIVEARRISAYFVPIPPPKKKNKQIVLFTQWTQDRVEENKFINRVREAVARWRRGRYVDITKTTARGCWNTGRTPPESGSSSSVRSRPWKPLSTSRKWPGSMIPGMPKMPYANPCETPFLSHGLLMRMDEITGFNVRTRYPDFKMRFFKKAIREFAEERLGRIKEFRKWLMEKIER